MVRPALAQGCDMLHTPIANGVNVHLLYACNTNHCDQGTKPMVTGTQHFW